ncbi:RNA polymerase C-22 sterol desaturase [Rhodotorula sphaerocarpa]
MPGGVNANGTDSKNWLVFGAGAHKCIGQSYVYHQMSAGIGTAAGMMDWEHEVTEESEEIKIIATIFPKDECRLKFTPRAGDHEIPPAFFFPSSLRPFFLFLLRHHIYWDSLCHLGLLLT